MADTYTTNLNLKKPGYDSPADIADINANMDKIDSAYKTVDAAKLNGKSAEYYTNPRNILVNSNFQEIDEIINQRGYISGTAGQADYCIDRWKLQYETALQLNNGYVTLTGGYEIRQIVSQKLKKGVTYTLAARMRASGGTRPLWLVADDSADNRIAGITAQNSGEWVVMTCLITPNADMSNLNVYITNSGVANVHTDIAWAALYEGEYNADNLPPYVPRGYANELLACQIANSPPDNTTWINGILFTFCRSANVAMMSLTNGETTSQLASGSVFTSIPDGFKPRIAVDFKDTFSGKRLQLKPDGNMIVMGDDIEVGTLMRGTITYICD